MANPHAEEVRQALLDAFGHPYEVHYPNGEKGSVIAKIDRVDKGKRVFWSAIMGEELAVGTILLMDSQRFEITRQQMGEVATGLVLIPQMRKQDYSEYE